jgi:cell division protein FtsL
MEISIEMALFIVAIVWFLLVTIIFLTVVKISLEHDEVSKLKENVDLSQKKIGDIRSRIRSIGHK